MKALRNIGGAAVAFLLFFSYIIFSRNPGTETTASWIFSIIVSLFLLFTMMKSIRSLLQLWTGAYVDGTITSVKVDTIEEIKKRNMEEGDDKRESTNMELKIALSGDYSGQTITRRVLRIRRTVPGERLKILVTDNDLGKARPVFRFEPMLHMIIIIMLIYPLISVCRELLPLLKSIKW